MFSEAMYTVGQLIKTDTLNPTPSIATIQHVKV